MSNWEIAIAFWLGTFYGNFVIPLLGKLLIYWANQIEANK